MQRLASTQSQHASLINIYNKTIDDLPPEVLRLIFTSLGSGYFRFIGGTSHIFRELYLSTSVGSDSTTTIENVVSSVSCVELYLQEAGTDVPRLRDILNAAASYGRLDILEWAHQRGYSHACSKATSACAAKQGQLRALIWLHDHGCALSSEVCINAAAGGHLNILQWARANEWQWNVDTCTYAAEGGHLHILQWARTNGCPWDRDTCSRAAACGHLNILQWARANECPWDRDTCFRAADGGHLHILQWARTNGCPWDEEILSSLGHRLGRN